MYLPLWIIIGKIMISPPSLKGSVELCLKESVGVPVKGLSVGSSGWLLSWFRLEHW